MKALILAAGRGTRLRPLTDARPKALVEIAGIPLLELVLRRLENELFADITVNIHHHPEQMLHWLADRRFRSRATLHISSETDQPAPLETGGGILRARRWLEGEAPFLVHNVDVLSEVPLRQFVGDHLLGGALATLAVQPRPSRRQLLFDATGRLCGRWSEAEGETLVRAPAGPVERLAFCGLHVLSPDWFGLTTETGAFSIIDSYLRLAAAGQRIAAWRADAFRWKDAGRPENLSPL